MPGHRQREPHTTLKEEEEGIFQEDQMGVALEGNRAHKAGSHGGALGRKQQRDAGLSFGLAGT